MQNPPKIQSQPVPFATTGKVLIAGGGIGGVTAALCLAKVGFEVAVFERAPEFGEIGAGLQLSPNCTRVLHHLGLAEALKACSFVPDGTEFRVWKSGRVVGGMTLGQSAHETYGFPYYHIHRADLHRVLVDAARQCPAIGLYCACEVTDFAQDASGVRLAAAGVTHTGDVLIGADGIHSRVRAGLLGDQAPDFTGNVAWRMLVPTERLPKGLIRPMATVWWGPGKHFLHYYVRCGALVNCTCVVEKSGWEVESWTEPGEYDELKRDFAGWHSDVQTLIDSADRDSLFKWALFDRRPMPRWSEGAVALLGDACHPTLPFMAQGAAMAIEDAAVLAGCLSTGSDTTAALERYAALRRRRTAWIQNGSRRNAEFFHLRGIKAWLRNRGSRRASGSIMDSLFRYDALAATDSINTPT